LEDSENRRSVGGHGNQHVRLRIAQVDRNETFCPALVALRRFEPRQASGPGFLLTESSRTSSHSRASLREIAHPSIGLASTSLFRLPMLSDFLQNKSCHSISS